jgi:hypothetical protein
MLTFFCLAIILWWMVILPKKPSRKAAISFMPRSGGVVPRDARSVLVVQAFEDGSLASAGALVRPATVERNNHGRPCG